MAKRPFFRYRISHLLVMMIPAAVIAFACSVLINDQPIDWIAYSPDELAEKRTQQQTVLVFYTANWDPTAKLVEEQSIDTFWIRRFVRKEGVETLRADCTEWKNNAHNELPLSIQFPATPLIAIYSPGIENPFLLGNFFTEDELYNALTNACR